MSAILTSATVLTYMRSIKAPKTRAGKSCADGPRSRTLSPFGKSDSRYFAESADLAQAFATVRGIPSRRLRGPPGRLGAFVAIARGVIAPTSPP